MNEKRTPMMTIFLSVGFALSPALGFAQGTTTFSGDAVALKATALGISLSLADTGQLPSTGGNLSNSVASINVAGIASANALSGSTSGSGSSSQSQSMLLDLNLLNGLALGSLT